MTRIIDISVPLRNGIPCWPGSEGFNRHWTRSFQGGDGVNVSTITADLHVGTHVDAPLHFVDGGASVDELPLETLCGPAQVVELMGPGAVTAAVLEASGVREGSERVLLKTRNSAFWRDDVFHPDYAALTADAAQWILDRGVRLIGVDSMSVQCYNDQPHVHTMLLEAGVVVVEGLELSLAAPGWYELICLPLRMEGAEGAPARAILRKAGE